MYEVEETKLNDYMNLTHSKQQQLQNVGRSSLEKLFEILHGLLISPAGDFVGNKMQVTTTFSGTAS